MEEERRGEESVQIIRTKRPASPVTWHSAHSLHVMLSKRHTDRLTDKESKREKERERHASFSMLEERPEKRLLT